RSPRAFFALPPYLDQALQPGLGSMPQSTAGFATNKATAPSDFVAPRASAPVPPPAPRSAAPAVKPVAPAPAAPAPTQAKENN
ncbi:MAG: hypothetical protein ACKO85_14345, partial [Isosphaeraceae bacterium]